MKEYLTTSQFDNILMLKVAIGLFIVYLMYRFAVRNPTDFDTIYRRRMRYIYGIVCAAFAIGFIYLAMAGPFNYSLPFYYLSTYGTFTPDDVALQFGITSNMIVREPSANCIWGRMTFEQWALSANISGAIEWIALAVYAFTMKRSSVKWFAKLRKAIGYVLLIIFPGQINGLHYFDLYEIAPLAIYILIVYLLVRTYKMDEKTPERPIESQHNNIPEFVAEHPEKIIKSGDNDAETGKKKSKFWTNFRSKLTAFFKRKELILWSICGISFVISFVLAIISYNVNENAFLYRDGFDYYEDWGVYLKNLNHNTKWRESRYINVDYNLGEPIHPESSMRIEFYAEFGSNKLRAYGYNQPMSARFLNYRAPNFNGESLFSYLHNTLNYPAYCSINIKSGRAQVIYWDRVRIDNYWYHESGEREYYNHWIRKHILEENNGMVYEFIVYMLDDKIYDESIEDIFSFECPYEKFISSETWMIWYCIFTFFTLVMLLIAIIFSSAKAKREVKNVHALRLLIYLMWCLFAEYAIHIIVVLSNLPFDTEDFEILISFLVILTLYLGFVRIPALMYVRKRISKDSGTYYLFPYWLTRIVDAYAKSETSKRAMLVLLIYPLFYICTLPAGLFAWCYLIPVIIVFSVVYTIRWIFKEHSPQIVSPQTNTVLTNNDSDSIESKLKTLKGLLNDKLITQEDYDKKKDEILRDFR